MCENLYKELNDMLEDKKDVNSVYEKSIILIGPSGAGKSTIARELEKRTGMQKISLDGIANHARKIGLKKKFKSADEFNYYMIQELLGLTITNNQYGIVDFGAGHSVYDDKEIFAEVKSILKPFRNIVLLLPCNNEEESLKIMSKRSTGDTTENKKFLESPCNRELATMIIYGNNRSAVEISDEILARIEEAKLQPLVTNINSSTILK